MSKIIDWDDLFNRIPSVVQIKKAKYHVLWVDAFPNDPTQLGGTDPNKFQITVKNGQTSKESVCTFLHEVAHAFNFEYEMKLTEAQVVKFEKSLHWVLKPGNIFKDKK